MSYVSTVLSFNPVAFWYLDQLLTSEGMIDLSGNGFHGVFRSPTLGLASPIETDADSRSAGGTVGYYYDAGISGSLVDVRSAFTLIGWGYWPGGSSARTILSRTAAIAFGGYNGINLSTGGIPQGELSFDTDDFRVTAAAAVPVGHFPMVALVRNGTALLLYVDGNLAAQRTDLPSGDLDWSNYNESGWKVGYGNASSGVTHGDVGSVWQGSKTCAVSIHPTALSANDIRTIYESALNVLPLRATIVINLGLELNTDQITPADFGFAHNFSDPFGDGSIPIVEELSYATNVSQSEPDYQQRISARPHGPLRTLEYHLTPSGYAARARLQGELYEPARFYTLPVWSDAGLTTDLATGDTIPCDTTLRDYEVDSYCGICTDPSDPFTYEFAKILAVSDTELTLTSDLSSSYSAGAYVFPARVVSISDDTLAVKSFAADHEASTIRFDVIEGELSTRRITTYTPSTTYKSLEVFTLESAKYNFLDSGPYDISRRIQAHGRDYQYAMDTGSAQTFPVRFLLTSRAGLSQFYGWLDARCGKLNPLFVSSKEHDYVALARPTGTTLTVRKAGFSLHQGRRHLEILKTDGSFVRVKLTAIQDNGNGTETLTSTDGFPTFATISRISFLKQCTLAQDTIRLEHYKGGANGAILTQSTINFKELLTSPA